MKAMLGSAIPELETAMRFRLARQSVLAANLANVDTPGYRRIDLRFESALERTGSPRTNPGHLGGSTAGRGYRIETAPPSRSPDGNGVVLEREVVTLSRNAGAFTDQAAVLSRLFTLTRIAVTGEAR